MSKSQSRRASSSSGNSSSLRTILSTELSLVVTRLVVMIHSLPAISRADVSLDHLMKHLAPATQSIATFDAPWTTWLMCDCAVSHDNPVNTTRFDVRVRSHRLNSVELPGDLPSRSSYSSFPRSSSFRMYGSKQSACHNVGRPPPFVYAPRNWLGSPEIAAKTRTLLESAAGRLLGPVLSNWIVRIN